MAGKSVTFQRTKIEIDLYGEKFNITRPSGGKLESFYESLAEIKPEDAKRAWEKFLVELGFTESAVKELEIDHFRELIDVITGVGKKSQTGG